MDVLLEEIIEWENLGEEECSEVKKKMEDEKIKAADIRRTAMESLPKTRKRKLELGEEKACNTKSRKSVSSAIEYLREKGQQQLKLKD